MALLHFCSANRWDALSAVDAYSKGFANRLLPTFDGIEAEATQAADAFYERAMVRPVRSDNGPDGSEIAEAATEHGFAVYSDLEFVRQQLTGLATAGLYHLWERILKEFIVRELSNSRESRITPDAIRSADFPQIVNILERFGWDVQRQPFYDDLDRLRLIANVVKHGDGASCQQLLNKAPDLFLDLGGEPLNSIRGASHLELNKREFLRFSQIIRTFFETFPERLGA